MRQTAIVTLKRRVAVTDKLGMYAVPFGFALLLIGLWFLALIPGLVTAAALVYGEIATSKAARIEFNIAREQEQLDAIES